VLRTGMPDADCAAVEAAHQDFHPTLVSGGDSLWLSRFLEHLHAQVRHHQRLMVLGRALLSDLRTDAALLATLCCASAIKHHTRLMDAVLDRDEARAVDLLQDHIGTAHVASAPEPTP
jgi:GntR family carbon starvation induced transcriptional regulator